MSDETEYRIEYQIQRRLPGEEDFTEIGFGSSGGWETIAGCENAISADIQRGDWETEPGQPNSEDVLGGA